MRAPRSNSSRCFVCRTVLKHTDVRCRTWSPTSGWYCQWRFCRPCWRALTDIALEVARDYK